MNTSLGGEPFRGSRPRAAAILLGAAALLLTLTARPAVAGEHRRIHGDTRPPQLVSAPAKRAGIWLPPRRWPVIGIHAFLLPSGEVLHYAYSEAEGAPDERRYLDGSHALVWHPRRETFFDVSWHGTAFCSGHSFLPDGRLFVTGGLMQERCPTQGRVETWLFDPFSFEWTQGPDMNSPRYYPTNLTLGDGTVMILSGNDGRCEINPVMELFDPDRGSNGKIVSVSAGARFLPVYPRVHLLPDGRVAHVGPQESTWVWSPQSKSWSRLNNTRLRTPRHEGASFVVPGHPYEIMTCGGYADLYGGPTETCERIDFSHPTPTWRLTAPMHYKRAHANAVVLPTGKILMVGGGAHDLYIDPTFNPELYDPESDSWTLLPAQRFGRMYHSTAILLPDGRVLSAGQDEFPTSPGDSGAWAEIYKPAYLVGARPRIKSVPEAVALGESLSIAAKGAAKVRSAVLMGLAAMTHSVNMGQRHVELEFSRGAKQQLEITIPDNANLVPPGYYMLFLLNGKGRTSPAALLRVE